MNNIKGKILGTLETIAMLPALPFFLLRMLGIGVVRASIRAEVWLGRNLAYWLVTQRRLAYGKPVWHPTDWQAFGVEPPTGFEPGPCTDPNCPGCTAPSPINPDDVAEFVPNDSASPPQIAGFHCSICDQQVDNQGNPYISLACDGCVAKAKAKEAA